MTVTGFNHRAAALDSGHTAGWQLPVSATTCPSLARIVPPTIETSWLTEATDKQPSTATLQVDSVTGLPPFKWSWSPLAGSKLPPSLTSNVTQGILSGKPTKHGNFSFTVAVTDTRMRTATRELSLTVDL